MTALGLYHCNAASTRAVIERSRSICSSSVSNVATGCVHSATERPSLPQASARQHRSAACNAVSTKAGTTLAQGAGCEYGQWAADLGIQAPSLALADFQGLRGMMAQQDIKARDIYAKLPRQAVLLTTPYQKCPFPDFVDPKFWRTCEWYTKMALMLLHERRQGAAGRMRGYVEALPKKLDTPIHWSQELLDQLEYPPVAEQVALQRQKWHALHQELVEASPACGISRDEFVWALEAVRSRAFKGPYAGVPFKDRLKLGGGLAVLGLGYAQLAHVPIEQVLNGAIAAVMFNILYDLILSSKLSWYAMCPTIDFMNHSSASQDTVEYGYWQDIFVLEAKQPVAKGRQAFITYGTQSNDSLVQYYGFVEPDNPGDAFVMAGSLLERAALDGRPMSPAQRAALNEAGLLRRLQQTVTVTRSGADGDTMQALRILLAPDPKAVVKTVAVEAQVFGALVKACTSALESFSSSLAEDQGMLAATRHKLDPEDILAAQFRVEKKKLLAACIEHCQRQCNKLSQVQTR